MAARLRLTVVAVPTPPCWYLPRRVPRLLPRRYVLLTDIRYGGKQCSLTEWGRTTDIIRTWNSSSVYTHVTGMDHRNAILVTLGFLDFSLHFPVFGEACNVYVVTMIPETRFPTWSTLENIRSLSCVICR